MVKWLGLSLLLLALSTELLVRASQSNGGAGGAPRIKRVLLQMESAGARKDLELDALNKPSRNETSAAEGSGTNRVDPLNGLKKYRGGYDIQNKHYWASAVFTGIYGYAIAAAVFLLGVVLCLVFIVYSFRRRNWRNDEVTYSLVKSHYVFYTMILVLATLIALTLCCMILAGNKRLNTEANNVEDIIIGAANNATATIYNITSVMSQISTTLGSLDNNFSASTILFSSKAKLYLEAVDIQRKVEENKGLIDRTLKLIYITVIVTSCLTMLVLIVGVGMMEFTAPDKMQRRGQVWRWLFSLTIVTFWILTIFSWIAFGLSYTAYNVVEDSCTALRDYQENPYSTALSSLLPCVDLKTGNDSVLKIREGMYRIIIQANRNISKLRTTLDSVGDNRLIPHICNPFSGPPHYKLTGQCLEGTVAIGSIPQLLQPFRCLANNEQECVSAEGEHIPNTVYMTILAYSKAAQTLIDATPSIESLTNCSFVVHAFSVIVDQKCRPVKLSVHILWAAYAGLSTIAILLLIFYVTELHRQKAYFRVSETSTAAT